MARPQPNLIAPGIDKDDRPTPQPLFDRLNREFGFTSIDIVEKNLADLIERHASEWRAFLESQGSQSFLLNWARGAA